VLKFAIRYLKKYVQSYSGHIRPVKVTKRFIAGEGGGGGGEEAEGAGQAPEPGEEVPPQEDPHDEGRVMR
jgi:hypothetical protein